MKNLLCEKFFSVQCKCGHGDMGNKGQNYYIPIEFAIIETDGKAAAEKARWLPRVKHHDRFAILSVQEINQEQFNEIKNRNNADLFLKVQSVQEQRMLIGDLSDRVIWEKEPKQFNKKESAEKKSRFHKNNTIRNPKKFTKYYHDNYISDEFEVS